MNPLQLKAELINAIHEYSKGNIVLDELYAVADRYIAALKEYKKETGKKFRIPSRAYLIRAFR